MIRSLAAKLVIAAASISIATAPASQGYADVALSWTFDNGDLSIAQSLGGSGQLTYKDAATQAATTFGVTSPNPPNPVDGPAGFLHHGQLPNGGEAGYQLSYTNVLPNGGGAYVNDYTMIFDVFIPQINWTPLFNTDPANGNDADWYVDPSGALGIGELGYSPAGTISANTWHRLGFVHDRTGGTVKYWVDGTNVFTGAAAAIDARYSLYSSNDAIPAHVSLHGEGDGSGNYTNEIYWNNFFFADFPLSDQAMAALGGVTSAAIPVPEPATWMLVGIIAAATAARRRRKS
jgi:hypothetical protein